jgi:hypothetical protein
LQTIILLPLLQGLGLDESTDKPMVAVTTAAVHTTHDQ